MELIGIVQIQQKREYSFVRSFFRSLDSPSRPLEIRRERKGGKHDSLQASGGEEEKKVPSKNESGVEGRDTGTLRMNEEKNTTCVGRPRARRGSVACATGILKQEQNIAWESVKKGTYKSKQRLVVQIRRNEEAVCWRRFLFADLDRSKLDVAGSSYP